MSKLILAAVLKGRGFQPCCGALQNQARPLAAAVPLTLLKMNFIFKMPDAILTLHVAEAH
jgi:hypothetical protein